MDIISQAQHTTWLQSLTQDERHARDRARHMLQSWESAYGSTDGPAAPSLTGPVADWIAREATWHATTPTCGKCGLLLADPGPLCHGCEGHAAVAARVASRPETAREIAEIARLMEIAAKNDGLKPINGTPERKLYDAYTRPGGAKYREGILRRYRDAGRRLP